MKVSKTTATEAEIPETKQTILPIHDTELNRQKCRNFYSTINEISSLRSILSIRINSCVGSIDLLSI